ARGEPGVPRGLRVVVAEIVDALPAAAGFALPREPGGEGDRGEMADEPRGQGDVVVDAVEEELAGARQGGAPQNGAVGVADPIHRRGALSLEIVAVEEQGGRRRAAGSPRTRRAPLAAE